MLKKFAAIAVCFMLSFFAFANDTYFFSSGGSLTPTSEKDTQVRMAGEVISITMEKSYYQITVDFDFYNEGNDVTLSVGFPFFEAGIGGHGKIYDFECWTNGKKTDYKDLLIDRDFSNSDYDNPKLENAYVRDVKFPANKTTKTRVTYKSEYGYDTEGSYTKYLYGTGSTWKGKIGSIKLIIQNNKETSYPDGIMMGKNAIGNKLHRTADNVWEADFYDVEPDYLDCFTIHSTDIVDDVGPKCWYIIFKGWETKNKIDLKRIYFYTTPQLRIYRNAFYAIHGYQFKSEDLSELFNSKDGWYNFPNYDNITYSDDLLSEVEKYNIDFVLNEEKARKNTEYKSLWDAEMAGTYVAEPFLQTLKDSASYAKASKLCDSLQAYDVLVPDAGEKYIISDLKFHDRYALTKSEEASLEAKIVNGKPCIFDCKNYVNYVQLSTSNAYSTELEKQLVNMILKTSSLASQKGFELTETGFIYKGKKYIADIDKWHYSEDAALILYPEDHKSAYLGLINNAGKSGLYTMKNDYDLVYEPDKLIVSLK